MIHKWSKYFKITTIVIISIICLVIVVSIIYVQELYTLPISKHNIENEFYENKEDLSNVAKYLEKEEYINIYITSTDNKGEMFVSKNNKEVGKHIQITDKIIATSIKDLFEKNNYNVITKEENGIYFQRWSNRDYGRGVVYSIDGEQPKNELITKLEPLLEVNWYYYEEK